MRTPLIALLLAGCGVESLEEAARFEAADMEHALVQALPGGGCGDLQLYVHDGTDTRAIFVSINGLATEAAVQGQTLLRSYPLPSTEASVRAQSGTDLTTATCSGVFPFPGPVVSRSWTAIGGTLEVYVDPDPNATPSLPTGMARARLRRVLFEDDATGQTFRIRRVEFPMSFVGLLPP